MRSTASFMAVGLSFSPRRTTLLLLLTLTSGCTTLGSAMSPYRETFGCKNADHGVCIHPDRAYSDAVAGQASKSDPAVTNDKRLLHGHAPEPAARSKPAAPAVPGAFAGYRASVYAKLQGLIDQPVTPMLKGARTVRTLILPYTAADRPTRLYMPRYVFSLLDQPEWVVGDYLVTPAGKAERAPVLDQVRDKAGLDLSVEGDRP